MEDNSNIINMVKDVVEKDVVEELLNPEIREMFFGTKAQKMITVYPLGYLDHKKVLTAIMNSVQKASEGFEGETEIELVTRLSKGLEDNVPMLVEKCTKLTEKEFMADVSAGQLMEFISIIMEVNFIDPIKKGTGLFIEMGSLLGGSQLLPQSVETTDIPSEILPQDTVTED